MDLRAVIKLEEVLVVLTQVAAESAPEKPAKVVEEQEAQE